MPAPIGWGIMRRWPLCICLSVRLSVRQSVLYLTLSREWKGKGRRKLTEKTSMTLMTIVTPFRGQKVESQGHQAA